MDGRTEVMAYADRHGAKQAADHYGIPPGTIRSWRSRARKRAARAAITGVTPSPAEQWLEHARQIADRYLKGACLQCGGAGSVRVPEARRGSLLIRRAMTIPCPTCGGIPRRIEVNELPRQEWVQGWPPPGTSGWAGSQTSGRRWSAVNRIRMGAGSRGGRMPEPGQLSLFCPTCCGALVVVAQVPNHDGDLVPVPAPCPTCRPRPAAPETWRAAAALAQRLTGAQA